MSCFMAYWHNFEFLSTPSVRRATGCPYLLPWGPFISIHALRAEGDRCRWRLCS